MSCPLGIYTPAILQLVHNTTSWFILFTIPFCKLFSRIALNFNFLYHDSNVCEVTETDTLGWYTQTVSDTNSLEPILGTIQPLQAMFAGGTGICVHFLVSWPGRQGRESSSPRPRFVTLFTKHDKCTDPVCPTGTITTYISLVMPVFRTSAV